MARKKAAKSTPGKNKKTSSGISADIGGSEQQQQQLLFLESLPNVRLPKCSACSTSWFSDVDKKGLSFHKDNLDQYIDEIAKHLVPFPRCECTTTLVTNPRVQELDEIFSQTMKMKSQDNTRTAKTNSISNSNSNSSSNSNINDNYTTKTEEHIMMDILFNQCNISSNDLQNFPQKAMCKSCIQKFLSSSDDIVTHDYRDSNQPNIKFSTRIDCPCCRKKFTSRSLNALLSYSPVSTFASTSTSTSSVSSKKNSNTNKKNASTDPSWYDSVVNTIKFVRFSKRLKRKMIEKSLKISGSTTITSTVSSDSNHTNGVNTSTDSLKIDNDLHISSKELLKKEFILDWLEEEVSSDDCFSCSESESGDDNEDNEDDRKGTHHRHHPKTRLKKRHIALDQGELKAELLKKDPLFRQEYEDLKFIERMQQTKEGRIKLGMEDQSNKRRKAEQLKSDEQMAKELEMDMNNNRQKKKSLKSHIKNFFNMNDSESKNSSSSNGSNRNKNNTFHHDNNDDDDERTEQLQRDEVLAKRFAIDLNRRSNNSASASASASTEKKVIEKYFNSGAVKSRVKNDRRRKINKRQLQSSSSLSTSSLFKEPAKKVFMLALDHTAQEKGVTQFFDIRMPNTSKTQLRRGEVSPSAGRSNDQVGQTIDLSCSSSDDDRWQETTSKQNDSCTINEEKKQKFKAETIDLFSCDD